MSSPRPTVNHEDAARADGVLRAWLVELTGKRGTEESAALMLRGLLMAAFADCRADAYGDALLDYRAANTDPAPAP